MPIHAPDLGVLGDLMRCGTNAMNFRAGNRIIWRKVSQNQSTGFLRKSKMTVVTVMNFSSLGVIGMVQTV